MPQLTGEREIKTGRADAANYPSYDPQVWGDGNIDAKAYEQLQKNPGKPLFSQAIQGGYAPGSTFKVITTAAAVSTPSYPLSGTYECPTVYKVGNQTFTNFEGVIPPSDFETAASRHIDQ